MRIKRIIPLLCMWMVSCVCVVSLFSEELSLDVDSAVRMALENNFNIKKEQLNLSQKERAKNTSWNYLMPSVTATTSLARSYSSAIDSNIWSESVGFSAALNLNAALVYGMRQNVLNYEAGVLTLETAKRGLARDIKKAFYNLLVLQENMRITKLSLDNAEKLYLQAQVNYENGRASRYTMLTARVSWENMKPSYLEMENAFRLAMDSFKQTLGLSFDTNVTITGNIEAADLKFDEKELISKYLGNRLDVQMQRKSIEILENSLKASRALLTPSLTLQYSKTTLSMKMPDVAWSEWSDTPGTFSLILAFPLDNLIPGSTERNTIKNTEDQIKQAQLALDQTIKSAELNISSLVKSV
ncbi:MAG TPA: TolC family protein, partial [Spirochaetia bacterium]|nr:TolC family protein [Spirochaetia bacterium]